MPLFSVISLPADSVITVRPNSKPELGFVIEQEPGFYWSITQDQFRQLVTAAQAVLETKTDEEGK